MHSGTFRDRQKLYAMPLKQKVHHITRYDDVERKIIWCQTLKQNITDKEVQKWEFSEENEVTFLASSMFCEPRLFKLTQEIFQKAQIQKHQESVHRNSSLAAVNSVLKKLTEINISSESSKFNVVMLSEDEPNNSIMKNGTNIEHKFCKDSTSKDGDISVCNTEEELPEHGSKEDSLIDKVLYRTYSSPSPVCECNTVFYIDLCPPICTCETEIHNQPHLVHWMSVLLQRNNTLIIQMTPGLTRFTAGLVYLLCHCFTQVDFLSDQEAATFRQVLICYQYRESPNWVLEHLQYTQDKVKCQQRLASCDGDCSKTGNVENSGEFYDVKNKTLLETVPMQVLSSDFQFMMSMRRSNAALLKSFANSVVDREMELNRKKNTDS